ncbi:MAG: cell division protein FtsZ, partial [Eudoraea sp.]|nr:cell division protein FtsZ [Eudoraea sp.]
YTQNIDLRDAKTVLSNSGTAIMGSSMSSGSARAQEAIMKALDSPLLNDNKITGAKNVLLLIVSGSQEITIDEIGEINDHIQIEAGHGANIIMGVGEDENLGEAIAVTVIATGFNMDQQDEIVNTETKKIIHTLEDEQKAEQDLSEENVVYHLEEEEEVFEPIIKHSLEEEETIDLIPTTNYIRNFNVFYDEVIAEEVSKDDFIIIDSKKDLKDIEVIDPEELAGKKDDKEQIALHFDMPLTDSDEEENENVITFSLDENINDLDVNEHIEVIPVLEYNKEGETRYSLDDYMELENKLTGAKSKAEEFEPKLVEDELVFERKTVAEKDVAETNDGDPMNTPIEEILRERADERRRKLKDFNYKFQNSVNNIDEIEKEPAYKRQGIDLNENPKEGKVSRTTLGEDSNDEIQLRSNNSFLHDNVD